MPNKKVVLWIDEEQRALDSFAGFLQECFGDEVILVPEMPKNEIVDMLDRISVDRDIVAIVLDQKLKSTGMARYTGIELAEAIRRNDAKLPVYMLTNHKDDIGDLEYQVEYVLEKDYLCDGAYLRTVSARVRRHINVFKDIISEREQRFDELLRKSIGNGLTADEEKEFAELDFWRNKSVLSQEEHWAEDLKKELDEQEGILRELRREIEVQKKEG